MAPARAVVALGSTTLLIPKTVTSIAAAATDTAITVRARKEVVVVMAISRQPQPSMLERYRGPNLEAVMHITKRRFLLAETGPGGAHELALPAGEYLVRAALGKVDLAPPSRCRKANGGPSLLQS